MMKTWLCDSGQKLEIFIPFLGKYRPLAGRCCQTCTPKSWDNFYQTKFSSLGFRDAVRLTEEDTRYRGWLVRRVCGILAVWGRDVPDTPRDLATRICCRVCGVAAGQPQRSGGDSGSQRRWKEEILRILAGIQAPLARPLLRFCAWVLLKLLSRLFLSVQLHRGQLATVQGAAGTPDVPLLFLCAHKSPLDAPLLALLLFSQGLGAPRVALGGDTCTPRLRALLARLGGVFLPPQDEAEGLAGAVLAAYVAELLRSRQPLLLFLEEPALPRVVAPAAQRWLRPVCLALRQGAVPDVTVVPVGIAYDVTPGDTQALGLVGILRVALGAGPRNRGCARVDFGQPFSLQEFAAQGGWIRAEPRPEELPGAPGTTPSPPGDKAAIWGPGPTVAVGPETEEETLATRLGLHALSDTISCSAVTAVEITSALLLHKHRGAVLLSRLLRDFAWLLEEILLRQRDVGFSGQLQVLVWHSLALLSPRVTLHRLAPCGDALVVPGGSAEARGELRRLSAAVLPVFACEAVGACAIRALLLELLPFLGSSAGRPGIVLSQDELQRKTLELLRLLPPNLLGLQPCQPPECRSRDVLDKLLLCGLLEAEEPEGDCWACDVSRRPWARMDFSDSDSDSADELPKRCFKLSEPQGCPGFLLFLCRLLSPILGTFARAVTFLERPQWPQPEAVCLEALLQFLAEGDDVGESRVGGTHTDPQRGCRCSRGVSLPPEPPSRSAALSALQTFKDMGVLEELWGPAGPQIQLTQPFRCAAARAELETFVRQFVQM
ncbi:glycerol-3-phosphate acyltransferase 2, mitochondrial-like [Caloenas nicobarica]|uniref:glycerol-3-phosphate acyltransferase 2, mitochondrial-like n=1 Tax=Caloenas nicobarica TaxID=187106 RepID=UPI0032B828B9